MSSVHDRLAECEQRNGGHLEDVTSGMVCCVFFLSCVMFQDHWFTYFCKCYSMYFLINVTVSWYPILLIFVTLKNRPIRWWTLYLALYFFSTGLNTATGIHFPDSVLVMNQKLSQAELNTQQVLATHALSSVDPTLSPLITEHNGYQIAEFTSLLLNAIEVTGSYTRSFNLITLFKTRN